MADWTLRTANGADLDAIMALETESFPDPWPRSAMASELQSAHGRYIVIVEGGAAPVAFPREGEPELGGRVLGYAGLRAVGTEGDIQTIAVSHSARGSGIGRALMAELIAEAARRGVREIFLEVRVDNAPAIGLYAALGFEKIGTRRGYYQGIDADVMRKELR